MSRYGDVSVPDAVGENGVRTGQIGFDSLAVCDRLQKRYLRVSRFNGKLKPGRIGCQGRRANKMWQIEKQ